ncbi:MAG: sugar phosphate isomerase/epimerase [Candidatus Didemnitutus sp.]|nr:sugar phosphate isomerase/epimerase [Candidatus Didemnitutus sp.]
MPTYHRAISTLGCHESTLDEVLALATRHRLEAVELRALEGTVDLPRLLAERYGTPTVLAEKLSQSPVRLVSFDTSWKLAGAKPGDREAFLEFIPWAEALGVPWLRVFDGGKPNDAATQQEMADSLAWWRAHRTTNGWKSDVMIETHDSLFTAAAIQQFAETVLKPAILWDTHHTWKKGGEDPVVTWTGIRPLVVHCHVKDSVPQPSARHPFTYVLPGDGGFPMAGIQDVLAREFSGVVSLEWERLWHPYLPTLDCALHMAAERKWW